MKRFKVTASPLKSPMYFQGETEDEAWDKAEKLSWRNGVKLYNGFVEQVPTEAEKDVELVNLKLKVTELETQIKAILEAYPMAKRTLE